MYANYINLNMRIITLYLSSIIIYHTPKSIVYSLWYSSHSSYDIYPWAQDISHLLKSLGKLIYHGIRFFFCSIDKIGFLVRYPRVFWSRFYFLSSSCPDRWNFRILEQGKSFLIGTCFIHVENEADKRIFFFSHSHE